VSESRIRKYLLFSLLLVTPAGFLFKFYSGPAQWWFNDYGTGVLYVTFWVLLVSFLLPDKRWAPRIPVWVFLITSALEILQLWHTPPLEKIRSYFLGRALIGTSFTWWDFPHYAIGSAIGWAWTRWVRRLAG